MFGLTVGKLRELFEQFPSDTPVFVINGIEDLDQATGIEIRTFRWDIFGWQQCEESDPAPGAQRVVYIYS